MQIAFVASPAEAVKILLHAGPEFRFPVLASSGLASGFVMAVALNSLVAAVDPAPQIEASDEAVIHSEDAAPSAISTPASPNVVSAPVISLFQTNATGIKLVLNASWGLRAANSIAWLSGVTW